MERVYLGTGLQYPVTLPNGKGVLVSDTVLINQSIQIILGTPKGTRFFLADFGSRLSELLFEPNDEVIVTLSELFIREALDAWETRIKVLSVSSESDKETAIFSTIKYRILSSNEVESFVYPSYKK